MAEERSYDVANIYAEGEVKREKQPDPNAATRKTIWEEDGFTVVRTSARTAPGCHDKCGLLLYVKDGKVDHVEGDPEDPNTNGRLCPRCLALTETLYHPDRQLYPMKRAREDRGKKDAWERISWDEAYEIIVREYRKIIDKYGANSIANLTGTGRDPLGYGFFVSAALGTNNHGMSLAGQGCYLPRSVSSSFKSGLLCVPDYSQNFIDRYDNPEWRHPDWIVVWGNNSIVSSADGTMGCWITDCMKRGSKVITVDPKLTWIAGKSEYWLQVRPGTDLALALALGHIIVEEDLYDHDFVEKWTYGFEQYAERVKEITPEFAAEKCGLSVEGIYAVARAIGNAEAWALQWGVAMDHSTTGFYMGMATWDLVALCGQFDRPGGMAPSESPFGAVATWEVDINMTNFIPQDPEEEKRSKSTVLTDDKPVLKILNMPSPEAEFKAMVGEGPYPIKGTFMQATNPIANMAARSEETMRALQSTDFNLVIDLWMTPTAQACADVFLPVCCFPERPGITAHYDRLAAIVKAVEPAGESRSDQRIDVELGRALKGEDVFPWKTDEEFYDFILRRTDMTYEDVKNQNWIYPKHEYFKYEKGLLRADGKPGFNTPTGRYEFYSMALASCGLDPVVHFIEPLEGPANTPELAKEYPLILTTGARNWGYFHSEGRQIPSLRRLHPDPTVMIHPADAKRAGVQDGDWVLIENRYGSCKQKANVTCRIKEGVVSADHGFWFPERKDEPVGNPFGAFDCNINKLLPHTPGETGLGNSYKEQLCRISKAQN